MNDRTLIFYRVDEGKLVELHRTESAGNYMVDYRDWPEDAFYITIDPARDWQPVELHQMRLEPLLCRHGSVGDIAWLLPQGIVVATKDGVTFAPLSAESRGELAIMFTNAMHQIPLQDLTSAFLEHGVCGVRSVIFGRIHATLHPEVPLL